MFSINKEYIKPENYPKFIKEELLESQQIGEVYSKHPDLILKHYFKLIFLYTSILLFGLTMMVLSGIY
jgi:hypothetical protein